MFFQIADLFTTEEYLPEKDLIDLDESELTRLGELISAALEDVS